MNRKSQPVELTPEGHQRKNEMLGELQDRMCQIHTRRRRTKWGIATGFVLVLSAIGYRYHLDDSGTAPVATGLAQTAPGDVVPESSKPVLTNHTMAKYVVNNPEEPPTHWLVTPEDLAKPTAKFETIDDDQLLNLLANFGHPATLGTVDGKKVLVSMKRTKSQPSNDQL